jgi:exosortase/archaeosortase family protein
MCASAFSDMIGSILRRNSINNMFVFHIYTVVEFTFISLFYIKIVSDERLKRFIIGLIFLFIGIAIFDYIKHRDQLDDLSTTTESIIVMLYAILGFSYMLKNPIQSKVFAIPLFWFNTAFLIYFAGNLFLFIFSSYIQSHFQRQFYELWGIHAIMSILFYLLMSTGFWKTKAR